VTVAGQEVGAIGAGLCAFVGVTHSDDATHADRLARRLWGLRIFEDDHGFTNCSAEELGLEVLVASQFTLYADTSRGRRPSFVQAAPPEMAEPLIDVMTAALRRMGARVATGRFRTSMQVQLINDGPFTVLLDV
jgi:D-tyrosyl-tRNA(Tyr) deacylase